MIHIVKEKNKALWLFLGLLCAVFFFVLLAGNANNSSRELFTLADEPLSSLDVDVVLKSNKHSSGIVDKNGRKIDLIFFKLIDRKTGRVIPVNNSDDDQRLINAFFSKDPDAPFIRVVYGTSGSCDDEFIKKKILTLLPSGSTIHLLKEGALSREECRKLSDFVKTLEKNKESINKSTSFTEVQKLEQISKILDRQKEYVKSYQAGDCSRFEKQSSSPPATGVAPVGATTPTTPSTPVVPPTQPISPVKIIGTDSDEQNKYVRFIKIPADGGGVDNASSFPVGVVRCNDVQYEVDISVAHSFRGLDSQKLIILQVGSVSNVKSHLLAYYPEGDVSVFMMPNSSARPPVFEVVSDINQYNKNNPQKKIVLGTEMCFIGHPGGEADTSRQECVVTAFNRYQGAGNLEVTVPARQGYSGGPLVLRSTGAVFGVVIASDPRDKRTLTAYNDALKHALDLARESLKKRGCTIIHYPQ